MRVAVEFPDGHTYMAEINMSSNLTSMRVSTKDLKAETLKTYVCRTETIIDTIIQNNVRILPACFMNSTLTNNPICARYQYPINKCVTCEYARQNTQEHTEEQPDVTEITLDEIQQRLRNAERLAHFGADGRPIMHEMFDQRLLHPDTPVLTPTQINMMTATGMRNGHTYLTEQIDAINRQLTRTITPTYTETLANAIQTQQEFVRTLEPFEAGNRDPNEYPTHNNNNDT